MSSTRLIGLLAFSAMSVSAFSAQTAALFLRANGTAIDGDSMIVSMGRDKSIEVLSFGQKVATAREAASGLATGRRTYEPIVFRKRIDKSTPLIARALTNNEVIEAEFRFYRPNPAGDGTTEHFFTIKLTNGRVASIQAVLPDTLTPGNASMPMYEEVSFVFHTITWTYTNGGYSHSDTATAGGRPTLTPLRPPLNLSAIVSSLAWH